jgi:hemerythrin-like metal-binding protein
MTPEKQIAYNAFWNDLKKGITKKEINQITFNNSDVWIDETYIPVIHAIDEKPYKILKIGYDVTAKVKSEQQIKEQQAQLNQQLELLKNNDVRIRKELLTLSEYRSKVKTLETELKLKEEEIIALQQLKQQPVIAVKPESIAQVTKSLVEPQSPETANKVFGWNDLYITGINELDEHHKQIINLYQKWGQAIALNRNKKEVKELFRSFIDFTAYHFGAEESYFEQYGYDQNKQHQNEHRAFIKWLETEFNEYNSLKAKALTDVLDKTALWLDAHFSNDDKGYITTLKKYLK